MDSKDIITWLLEGDVSVQYQVQRDLLKKHRPALQKRIATEGWGQQFLSKKLKNGHWGMKYYQPKWISSHYTLLDLRAIELDQQNPTARETVDLILEHEIGPDGGINPSPAISKADVCLNGMVLNFSSYFRAEEDQLKSIINFILEQQLHDGGFNCRANRSGARHSSLHSTLSVCEGLFEFERQGYTYKLQEIQESRKSAEEFILMHRLFLSDRTGEVIRDSFKKFVFPPRWYYDVLRAMDYFQLSKHAYDNRMEQALELIHKKRRKDMRWNNQAAHPGQVHFTMEPAGKPSRWNTLRALRILLRYEN